MQDECFIRGGVPMTKSEIRAVSLSKLELREGDIVYDVGAGTGSVSVEAALFAKKGHVYAIEKEAEGCCLIGQNKEKFQVGNLTVKQGEAPEAFQGLPAPDRVFVGGSGGRLEEILDYVRAQNPQLRAVSPTITLETVARIPEYAGREALEAEVVCVQVSKARQIGQYHMMAAQNPVYIATL